MELLEHKGIAVGFQLEVERDIALANKYHDHLKEKYFIPGLWWLSTK